MKYIPGWTLMSELEACKFIQRTIGLKLIVFEFSVTLELQGQNSIVGSSLIEVVEKAINSGW